MRERAVRTRRELARRKRARRRSLPNRALDLAPKYYREMRQHKQVFPPPPETPLLGTIAAGRPIESYSNPDTLSFADFRAVKDVYARESAASR